MKLCPYPFSRMQTKNDQVHTENKGGFFPCCPSWFNQSYWDFGLEKNLDDIWNGKQAQELRKRMYEGDYSFCNRGECKIPLMSIDEMANPDINFIETPISKENLEAIKQKNPIMPKQPASLHLVADTRCNLKCPTCRPEIISNTVESVEADEEYDLVQRLKDDVEIIKMSSSEEVFYSQVQRKLLKSFNKDDFPKLRRVHIVSNGTLFNQKAYNDLSPGTSYIKDISISLDAGSKEVYEKLRGPYWEQVVSNLEWLGQMRKAGKFELLTLNCTLIKDNYRDIPNLVELGRKNNVDRILIQKYNFALNQGFKTHKEQVDQAIHLPTHPEHIHMVRTLEMFKDDTLVHTLLDIEGFDQKIEEHIRLRKALLEVHNLKGYLENEEFLKVLIIANDLMRAEPLESDRLEKIESMLENEILDLDIPEIIFQKNQEAVSDIRSNIIAFLIDAIYVYHGKEQFKKVIKTYILLSCLSPEYSSDLLSTLANSLKNLDRQEEADFFRKRALDKKLNELNVSKSAGENSEVYKIYMQLAYLLKQHSDLLKAIVYFEEASKIEPIENSGVANEQLYYLYHDLAFSLKQQSSLLEAITYFEKALAVAPVDRVEIIKDQIFYIGADLGSLFKKDSKFEEAKKYFQKSLSTIPADKTGMVNSSLFYIFTDLGFILKAEDKFDEAINYFRKGLEIAPEDKKSMLNEQIYYIQREKGFSHQRNGKYIDATVALKEALKYGVGDPYLFFSLGVSLKRQKKYFEAKSSFNQALSVLPDHYYSLMELGAIEFLEGNNEQAKTLFLKGQKVEPEDKKAYGLKMLALVERKKKFN